MGPAFLPNQKLKASHGMDMADMEVMVAGVAGMDANAVKQTPMPLQSQKPMPGMAMDTIHTTLATTILVKEKLRLSHNHGMDMEDMAMEVMLDIGDANAVKLKASHITMDITHTSVDITILANDLLKPKLPHGEDTVDGADMEDMVKFVNHEEQTSMN